MAALRRAHEDGEDPSRLQCRAVGALCDLLYHSQGSRVADGLVRAAVAEGSAGSLLGALAGLLATSVDGGRPYEDNLLMFSCPTTLLTRLLAAATAKQLHLLHVLQHSPVAEASVRALCFWLTEASDIELVCALPLMPLVADLAGFRAEEPCLASATADNAATRAALRDAPGTRAALWRFLAWARREPQQGGNLQAAVAAAKWLLRLPEVRTQAAAAVSQQAPAAAAAPAAGAAAPPAAGAAVAAAAAGWATTGPASDAPTAALAPAAAAAPPPPAAPSLSAMQQPRDGSSTGSTCSIGRSSNVGDSSCSGEAAAPPHACGGCGKSESETPLLRCVGCKAQYYCGDACARAHWPSHRAPCKAARRASAAHCS